MADHYNNPTGTGAVNSEERTERLIEKPIPRQNPNAKPLQTQRPVSPAPNRPVQQASPRVNPPQNNQYANNQNRPYNPNQNMNQVPQVNVYNQIQTPVVRKSKAVAAILCFFFGTLGFQRFYLGYGASGVVMLLLEIFGWATLFFYGFGLVLLFIDGLWAFIDFFRILFGSLRPRDGIYG